MQIAITNETTPTNRRPAAPLEPFGGLGSAFRDHGFDRRSSGDPEREAPEWKPGAAFLAAVGAPRLGFESP